MSIGDETTHFNPGVIEEKVKFMQKSIDDMKTKNEENWKKIDEVLLRVTSMGGTFDFISSLYKEISQKQEENSGCILVLQNDVNSIKEKHRTNHNMIRSLIVIVVGAIVGFVVNHFTQ